MTTLHQHFEKNTKGSDYIVGDIHGCFTKLKEKLKEIGFNNTVDRLFSVGDLVDRGPESEDSLDWLYEPWFFAVRGNHEQMAINAVQGYFDPGTYAYNGGSWFMKMSKPMQDYYAEAFEKLPLALEIETGNGFVGIVHAECPVDDWVDMPRLLETGDHFINTCVWSRDRISRGLSTEIKNVSKVYVGHTVVKTPVVLGNVYYIDTGAVFSGELTVVKIS